MNVISSKLSKRAKKRYPTSKKVIRYAIDSGWEIKAVRYGISMVKIFKDNVSINFYLGTFTMTIEVEDVSGKKKQFHRKKLWPYQALQIIDDPIGFIKLQKFQS